MIFLVVWNLLILSAFAPIFLEPDQKGFPFGIGINIALGLVFLTSVLAAVSEGFRKLILKEGREFEDIKKFIYGIIFLSAMLSISFGLARFK